MDDFGTGTARLSFLSVLRSNYLKSDVDLSTPSVRRLSLHPYLTRWTLAKSPQYADGC
ncbi:hypothetical protein ACNKHS_13295 [Shigella flexneri]